MKRYYQDIDDLPYQDTTPYDDEEQLSAENNALVVVPGEESVDLVYNREEYREEYVDEEVVYDPEMARVGRSKRRKYYLIAGIVAMVVVGVITGSVLGTSDSGPSGSISTPDKPIDGGMNGSGDSATPVTPPAERTPSPDSNDSITPPPPEPSPSEDGNSSTPPTPSPENYDNSVSVPPPTPEPTRDDSPVSTPAPTPKPTREIITTRQPTRSPTPRPTSLPTRSPNSVSEEEEILRSFSRTGGTEFDDSTSYQSRALQWLLQNNKFQEQLNNNYIQKSMSDLDRTLQRFALACIYFATNRVRNAYTDTALGGNLYAWNHADGWLGDQDECTWWGVSCTAEGRVRQVQLEGNALTGSFPYEVVYLKDGLEVLKLSRNFFHNANDDGWDFLEELVHLRVLRAHDTVFQYEGLPPQLARLEHLEELDLSYNILYGELDEQMFSGVVNPFPSLVYLELSGNSFAGTIPRGLARLPKLQYLYLRNDGFEGDLSFLQAMDNPIEVWVDRNPSLSGQLSDIVDLVSLQSFSATRCNLNGPMPRTIGNLLEMRQMWLSHNELTGSLPSELGLLSQLKTLELEGNRFVGDMPDSVCRGIHRPFGVLTKLHADCPSPVACSCCDCCGTECTSIGRDSDNNRRRLSLLLEKKAIIDN